MFRRAAICGLGLLGGSFAGAMRRAFPETEILGCDLEPSFVSQAARDGVLDGSFSPGEVPECDFVLVALPVFRSISVLSGILEKSGEGTVVIDTPNTYLYLVLGNGRAMRYGIGVGRQGFTWSGTQTITRKAEWPNWTPPA